MSSKIQWLVVPCLAVGIASFGAGCAADHQDDPSQGDEDLSGDITEDPVDPAELAEGQAEMDKSDEVWSAEAEEALAEPDPDDALVDADTPPLPDESDDDPLYADDDEGADPTAPTSMHAATANNPPSKCKRHLRVVMTVGTGSGTLRTKSNGCWTVEVGDDSKHRQCWFNKDPSHPSASTWVYDDTNWSHGDADPPAVRRCAAPSTAKRGYEYLAAPNASWRFIRARNLKAYFAEVYSDGEGGGANAPADRWSWYKGSLQIRSHAGHVFPIIGIGADPHAISHWTYHACRTIRRSGGYIGAYNPDWQHSDAATPRVKGLARALNRCTRK